MKSLSKKIVTVATVIMIATMSTLSSCSSNSNNASLEEKVKTLEAGGVLVGEEVKINAEVEFVKQIS